MKEKENHTAPESPAVTDEMLKGVGKILRHAYLAGEVSADRVMQTYKKNLREADCFSFFGPDVFELMRLEQTTHNPVLRQRLQGCIAQCKEKTRHSHRQNIISVQKHEHFRHAAFGIGLHRVVAQMIRLVRKSQKTEDKIVLALLETEFANLTAKQRSHHKEVIYERKQRLLAALDRRLKQTDWTYGINYNTGKNASYIIYVYLPGGV